MKHSRLSAVEKILLVILVIMAVGGIASMSLTQNPDWTSLHLSRLGEGGHLSSYLFNATAALSGLAMLELAVRLIQADGWKATGDKAARRDKMVIAVALRAIAVCLVGLSIFPYDKFVVVHNIFGYGMTLIYLVSITYLTYSLPVFGRRFRLATNIFLTLTLGMFAFYFLFNGRQITLLQVQALGLVFFFVWTAGLARRLR